MPFRPDRLKALREAKGLSQMEVGEKAGLSHSAIAKSESGRTLPGSQALDNLARALDCTIDYLHGRGPEYESPEVAARHMAFDVFIAQHDLTDNQSERCGRLLHHHKAPNTSQGWRSLVELIELAIAPTKARDQASFADEERPKSKPMAIARRRN